MSRPARYVKPPGRVTRPGTLMAVHVETRDTGVGEADPRSRSRLFRRSHVAYTRWRRGQWTPTVRASFGDPDACWHWIHANAQTKGSTYVVSEIASDCLVLLRPWKHLTQARPYVAGHDPTEPGRDREHRPVGNVVVRRMVLQGRPDIFQYSVDGKSVCWLSGRQFFDVPTADLRAMLAPGGPVRGGPAAAVLSELREYADDEIVWLEGVRKFADWFAGLNSGRFPLTVPNASYQFFRSRMGANKIVSHSDQDVITLERRAAHGGRASCYYVGDIVHSFDRSSWPDWYEPDPELSQTVGSSYLFDIQSTYPTILRDDRFPVRLIKFTRTHDPSDVYSLLDSAEAVASVQLKTEDAEYPHRTGDEVIYPVGEFTAVLCGPELRRALADGIVTKVNEVAYYEPGRVFASAAVELLTMRADAKAGEDKVWELMVKLLGNSLGGKLAQRPLGWVRSPSEDSGHRWGDSYVRNADTGATHKYRYINGLAFERKVLESNNGTLLACFAHLCSYCRYKMRLIREMLPARSVYSQDTDGLWVNGVAASVLRNPEYGLTTEQPGGLKEVRQTRALRLLGPKHYRSDTGWVLAGFHKPQARSRHRISDCYTHNPLRCGTRAEPSGYETLFRTSNLTTIDPGGYVGEDGWLVPWRLPAPPGEEPPPPAAPPPPPAATLF